MKNKGVTLLLTLVLCISTFTLPMEAMAAESTDTTPPTLTVTPVGENVRIVARDEGSGVDAVYMDGKLVASLCNGSGTVAIKDYVTVEKTVGVYAVDHAGNRSEMVFFNSPDPNAAAQATQSTTPPKNTSSKPTQPAATQPQPTETTVPAQSNPLTPDGSGTVLDEANGDDDKHFYTITTAAGNVFYLIVDGQRDTDNVYFLNGVTEDDLMALAEDSGGSISVVPAPEVCSCKEKCEAGDVDTSCPICLKNLRDCLGKEKPTEETVPPTEPVVEEPKGGGNKGLILLAIVSMALVAGVGYYVKIERPKQRAQDEEDFEDEGYGEDFDSEEAYGGDSYLPEDEEE